MRLLRSDMHISWHYTINYDTALLLTINDYVNENSDGLCSWTECKSGIVLMRIMRYCHIIICYGQLNNR